MELKNGAVKDQLGEEWKNALQVMSHQLVHHCFDYKRWKKRARHYSDAFLRDIQRECKRIDNLVEQQWVKFSQRYYHKNCSVSRSFLWDCAISPLLSSSRNFFRKRITPHDLYIFILFNRKALQKVCKKIDKKAKLDGLFYYWYHNVAKEKYKFLTNKLPVSYIKSLIYDKNETCPICLDDDYQEFIILDCGHIICLDCLHQLTKNVLKEKQGTPYNILQHYHFHHKSTCPTCRYDKPFEDFMLCKRTFT